MVPSVVLMAGSEPGSSIPVRIVVHKVSRVLEIEYGDGRSFRLPFEFLRVYSPSAEVRGHGPGQEVLQTGKAEVGIDAIEPVGNYAIQPKFSDGHATGIYSWDYLYRLGENQEQMWQDYLQRLEAAGATRHAASPATGAVPPGATGTGVPGNAPGMGGASVAARLGGQPGNGAADGAPGKGPIGAKALIRPR
jgi:DUF971 family protein